MLQHKKFCDVKQRFPSRVSAKLLPLSESKNLGNAFDEWRYTDNCHDLDEPIAKCQLCGHFPIRFHFEIANRHNGNCLLVGSECVKRFGIDVSAVFAPDQNQRQTLARASREIETARGQEIAEPGPLRHRELARDVPLSGAPLGDARLAGMTLSRCRLRHGLAAAMVSCVWKVRASCILVHRRQLAGLVFCDERGDHLVQLVAGGDTEVGADADVGQGDALLQRVHTDRPKVGGVLRREGACMEVDAVETQLVGAIDETVEVEGAGGKFILVAQGHTTKLQHDTAGLPVKGYFLSVGGPKIGLGPSGDQPPAQEQPSAPSVRFRRLAGDA